MKRKLLYLTILGFIILIFKNYNIVLSSTIEAVNIWLYKVFPYLFIMIIANDLLINADFAHLFPNNLSYIFIMSLLSGTPTSAYIITNLYQEKKISNNNANYALLFTYFCNPLFLFTILNLIFPKTNIPLKLIGIHYLSNILIYFFVHKHLDKEKSTRSRCQFNLTQAIKKSITTTTMVLGAITFYMVLSQIILNTFLLPTKINLLFQGTLEVTQGLNALIGLSYSLKIKELFACFFISFGGLSIHTQIKCILEETDLEYRYFLFGRFFQLGIALILTAIT
ncbi:MAG: hypothetical protein K2M17_05450 [Bacilli bacterium]|nr:hypothetical protein [Bacilli bacterium]